MYPIGGVRINMTIEFIKFDGYDLFDLPTEYTNFVGKFTDDHGNIEYNIITRLTDDLFQVGAVFHFDFDWGKLVGYRGID